MYLNVFLLPVLCVSPPGAVNVLLTTPMWVVNTRLKLQGAKFRNEDLQQTHYRGIFGVCYSLLSLFSTNKMWLTIIIQCVLSIADAFSQIIASEGVGTLWNGTLPSLVLVFNPAVVFMFYEAMKRRAGRGGRKVREGEEGASFHTSVACLSVSHAESF